MEQGTPVTQTPVAAETNPSVSRETKTSVTEEVENEIKKTQPDTKRPSPTKQEGTRKQTAPTAPKKDTSDDDGDEPKEELEPWKKVKHRLKVNGKEQELDYDEMVRRAQLYPAADEKFQEASRISKETKAQIDEIKSFKENPWAYLQKQGLDPYEAAQKLIWEQMQWEQMSPEQKELAELRRNKAELEGRVAKLSERDEQESRRVKASAAVEEIDAEIGEALKSLGKKPTPRLIQETALLKLAHLESGGRLDAAKAVAIASQSMQASAKEWLESLTPEQALSALPKTLLDGLKRLEVQKALAQDPLRSRQKHESQAQSSNARPRKEKITSTDGFLEALEKRFG